MNSSRSLKNDRVKSFVPTIFKDKYSNLIIYSANEKEFLSLATNVT